MGKHEAITKLEDTRIDKVIFTTFGILLCLTILSTLALVNTHVSAETTTLSDSKSATASVNVNAACTMSTTGNVDSDTDTNTHTATLTPGTFTGNIGLTNVTATCNDPLGFAVYAIGYSNNTYGNNTLINTMDNTITIPTGTATSGDVSNWSMKLGNGTGDSVSIVTSPIDYSNYAPAPSTYAKVATYTNGTTTGQAGTSFTTTYGVYVSPTQQPGTYTGAVRYTLVHPNNAIPQPTYYMQDFTIGQCEVLAHDAPIEVVDKRDNEVYKVQYLKDGNCWMLDNLRLGSNDYEIPLSPLDTNIKEPWVLPKGVTEGFNSYTTAQINAAYKNDVAEYKYGLGSGKIGVYYNYCAVSSETHCGFDSSGDAEYDVCPAGWRMPTGGEESGEYRTLFEAYNSIQIATDPNSLQHNLSTSLTGYYYGAIHENDYGDFWSSTYSDIGRMCRLLVGESSVRPNCNRSTNMGLSTRCLANNP